MVVDKLFRELFKDIKWSLDFFYEICLYLVNYILIVFVFRLYNELLKYVFFIRFYSKYN